MQALRRLAVGSIAAVALLATVPALASASASPSFSGSGSGFSSPSGSPIAAPTLSLLPQAAGFGSETVTLLNPFSHFTVYFRVSKGGPVLGVYDTSSAEYFYSLGNCNKSTCSGKFQGDPGPNGYSISVAIWGYNVEITNVTCP